MDTSIEKIIAGATGDFENFYTFSMFINLLFFACSSLTISNKNTENVPKRTPSSHWNNWDFIPNSSTNSTCPLPKFPPLFGSWCHFYKIGEMNYKISLTFWKLSFWVSMKRTHVLGFIERNGVGSMGWLGYTPWLVWKEVYLRRISRYCQLYSQKMEPHIGSRPRVGTGNLTCWFLMKSLPEYRQWALFSVRLPGLGKF